MIRHRIIRSSRRRSVSRFRSSSPSLVSAENQLRGFHGNETA